MSMLQLEGEAEPVGTHQHEEGVYSARAWVPVEAPALAISNVAPTGPLGPQQRTGHEALDDWLIAQSPARDVPRDYFPPTLAVGPLLDVRDEDFACVIANGQVQLDLATEDWARGAALATFLVQRAREVAGMGSDYAAVTAPEPGPDEVETEELRTLRELAEEAGAWVTLQLEREGNALTGRPRLEGHGDPLPGELILAWQDADAEQLTLRLRGELPGTGIRATLSPESRWLLGHLRRLGEKTLGDPVIDEAFVIRCARSALPAVEALREPLAGLAERRPRIDLFPDLVSVEIETAFGRADLAETLNAALRLWDGGVRWQIEGR
jgi:hypothetical protein